MVNRRYTVYATEIEEELELQDFIESSSGRSQSRNFGESCWNVVETSTDPETGNPSVILQISEDCGDESEEQEEIKDQIGGGGNGDNTSTGNPHNTNPGDINDNGIPDHQESNGSGTTTTNDSPNSGGNSTNGSTGNNNNTSTGTSIITAPVLLDLPVSILTDNINQYAEPDLTYQEVFENQEFAEAALDALEDGGEVDFEEQIINELTGKALCVYNKLKEQNAVRKILNNFETEESAANITFKLGDLPDIDRAQTSWPDSNNTITITLNNDDSFKSVSFNPNLFVANTIIHEVIHAEFLRQIIVSIRNNQISDLTEEEAINLLENGERDIIYEFYRNTRDWSHNFMADFYRDSFARITQEFDTGISVLDGQAPQQLYLDIAWLGLMNFPGEESTIIAFDNLPSTEKNRIINVLNNQLNTNANQTCN